MTKFDELTNFYFMDAVPEGVNIKVNDDIFDNEFFNNYSYIPCNNNENTTENDKSFYTTNKRRLDDDNNTKASKILRNEFNIFEIKSNHKKKLPMRISHQQVIDNIKTIIINLDKKQHEFNSNLYSFIHDNRCQVIFIRQQRREDYTHYFLNVRLKSGEYEKRLIFFIDYIGNVHIDDIEFKKGPEGTCGKLLKTNVKTTMNDYMNIVNAKLEELFILSNFKQFGE